MQLQDATVIQTIPSRRRRLKTEMSVRRIHGKWAERASIGERSL
jgi:hypothetical protein